MSLLDKVTIEAYNFVFVLLNVMTPITLDITQSYLQFNSRWILQLINSISKDLQKLVNYFSGTAIFTSLNTPLSSAISRLKKLDLYLKDDEFVVLTITGTPSLFTGDPWLLNCHKLPEVCK